MSHTKITDAGDGHLYHLGGIAAFIAAGLTLIEVLVFAFYPQPSTVQDWFMLFQDHRIIGLLDFWGLEVPMYIMFVIVFLALYQALKNANPGLMVIALALALLGSGVLLATNNPFAMASLSNQYAAAATEAERATLLAAGQAILTNTNQRAIEGFNMGLFLVSLAGLMVSTVMLHSSSFTRLTANLGLLANALSLADYLRQALTASSMIALLVILPNALALVIWLSLVGRGLIQLGHLNGKAPDRQP